MSTPLVTVGITAFNAGSALERAVASAVHQTWRPLEVIIVDDASTDDTFARCERLAARYAEVRVYRQPENRGVAAARNRIIDEARGDFLAFFDDDDESEPERVGLQLDRIRTYEATFASGHMVVCHTARKQIAPDGTTRTESTMGVKAAGPAPNGAAVARRILAGKPLEDGYGAVATCSQMARVETYRRLGGFDSAFRRSEDTEFCIRLALAGGHFPGVAEPLVRQTLTPTADKRLADELRYKLALIDKHKDVFDNPAHYRFCRDWAETKYVWLSGDRVGFAVRICKSAAFHPFLTWQRLCQALPTLGTNRAFARFHRRYQEQ